MQRRKADHHHPPGHTGGVGALSPQPSHRPGSRADDDSDDPSLYLKDKPRSALHHRLFRGAGVGVGVGGRGAAPPPPASSSSSSSSSSPSPPSRLRRSLAPAFLAAAAVALILLSRSSPPPPRATPALRGDDGAPRRPRRDDHGRHHPGPPPEGQRPPPDRYDPDHDEGGSGGDGSVGSASDRLAADGGGDAEAAARRGRPRRRRRTSAEATADMLSHPSTFVDGERKLKAAMVELRERQMRGEDRGARVLTRWLGDDISPVAPRGEAEAAEWERRVKERRAELAEKERRFWEEQTARAKREAAGERVDDESDGDAPQRKGKNKMGAATREDMGAEGTDRDDGEGDTDGRKDREGGEKNNAVDAGGADGRGGSPRDEEEERRHAAVKGGRGRPAEAGGAGVSGESAAAGVGAPKGAGAEGGGGTAPRSYPSPSDLAGDGAVVVLEPAFGSHRPDWDAVFAFAEGYGLNIYILFLESLRLTGYGGDVVLAVSSLGRLKAGVEAYLRSFSERSGGGEDSPDGGPNVVVYAVDWTCYDKEGRVASGPGEGMRKCNLNGMYGMPPDGGAPDGRAPPRAVEDPRDARPVATARYELYWAWSLRYDPDRWIMLVDSRDTYFQGDPFGSLGGGSGGGGGGGDDRAGGGGGEGAPGSAGGELHLFEENADSSSLGGSTFNRNWLTKAYGYGAVSSFLDRPIVCSGSTIGHRAAVEPYLRAMVAQFDETGCMAKGCDQGFHNYLHYSRALEGTRGIGRVVVHGQGRGVINNLGKLRDRPLRERGVLVGGGEGSKGGARVTNWDGSTSPVVHQFDRDEELKRIMNQRRKEYLTGWERRAKGL